jgi:hypothetical protein
MIADGSSCPSSEVRQGLDHPVIDGDGHIQEFHPELVEYFREVAGPDLTERYLKVRLHGGTSPDFFK